MAGCGSLCAVRKSWLKWVWSGLVAHTDLSRLLVVQGLFGLLLVVSWSRFWIHPSVVEKMRTTEHWLSRNSALWPWLDFCLRTTQPGCCGGGGDRDALASPFNSSEVYDSERQAIEFGLFFFFFSRCAFFPLRLQRNFNHQTLSKKLTGSPEHGKFSFSLLLTTSCKTVVSPDDLLDGLKADFMKSGTSSWSKTSPTAQLTVPIDTVVVHRTTARYT